MRISQDELATFNVTHESLPTQKTGSDYLRDRIIFFYSKNKTPEEIAWLLYRGSSPMSFESVKSLNYGKDAGFDNSNAAHRQLLREVNKVLATL